MVYVLRIASGARASAAQRHSRAARVSGTSYELACLRKSHLRYERRVLRLLVTYGRCEQIFTLFFARHEKRTQSTSRSAPAATLMHIPVILRLTYTPRPDPNRRNAHH